MTPHSQEGAPLLVANALQDISSKVSTQFALKIAAAMYSFATLGLFNSSIGALLPLISSHYDLSDLYVSLVFVVGPLGYIVAAQMSSLIHHHFGRFGIALIGSVLQIIAAGLLSLHPHFELILVGFAVQGLGEGLLDGSWCAWAGSMERASTMSGLLHGSFSAGAAAAPILVTLMTTNGYAWFEWYYVLGALSIIDAVALCAAFWSETASVYRQTHQSEETENKAHSKVMLKLPATWWCAAYFLADVGVETAISGWVVSFMLRSRSATPYLAGLSSSGFWAGMAVGRLVLGPLTDKIGVRKATALYFASAILIEALFALLPYAIVSAVLMVALGFLMGPLFPSGIIVLTQLLPKELHVAAVSFVASLGQVGGALLPFGIGAVVEGLGIQVFRYAILVQSILAMLLWVAFAKLRPAVSTLSEPRRTRVEERLNNA
ncbi:MFS general substrate transporter [Macroventuria anomochaeta]|uniref:MFS general substrate transporter n=1 Tax=Macroventuria anomochaeta TaxID=301207 RepID=A0ACB6RJL3_9PLEO|nr:MFS general substrate transporter [Macroventuria anomochaeta]KAF2622145.1 MFS general substrate transporter [Macroventuria anomochaeta]